jgi:hypothetical protein
MTGHNANNGALPGNNVGADLGTQATGASKNDNAPLDLTQLERGEEDLACQFLHPCDYQLITVMTTQSIATKDVTWMGALPKPESGRGGTIVWLCTHTQCTIHPKGKSANGLSSQRWRGNSQAFVN